MTSEVAEWETVTLGDLASECRYGYTASAVDKPVGPKFLRITDLSGTDLDWASVPHCVTDPKDVAKYLLTTGDVVIARTGPVGTSAFIKDPPEAVFASYLVRFRFDTHRADPRFMGQLLRSPLWLKYVEGARTGSVQPQLNATIMKGFQFALPPLRDQHRIAWVLGSLDDKIENSRRIAEVLDQIATTLFKQRFVRFADHQGDSAESELGPIPHAWSVAPIGEVAQYINGKAFTKHGNGRGRMVIRIAELKSGPGESTVYTDYESEPDFIASPGDILFAWSGSLDVYRWYRKEALINQHIFKVIPKGYPGWFVYHALKHVMPHFQAIAADKATTMGHIKRSHLSEFSVAIPPNDELKRQDALFAPLYERALQARAEAETLVRVRDQLLPRLTSGERRVSEDSMATEAA